MISLRIDAARLQDVPAYVRRVRNLRRPMHIIGLAMASSTKRRIREGRAPSGEAWKTLNPITRKTKGSDKPLVDTGRLRASIRSELVSDTAVAVGSNLRYARLQQTGGTIRPKNARFLAIPLIRQFKNRPPRRVSGLFVVRSHRGNLLLAKREGNGIKPCYLLRKRVKVPPRPYLGLSRQDASLIRQILLRHFAPGGRA